MKNNIVDVIRQGQRRFEDTYCKYPNLLRIGANPLREITKWQQAKTGIASIRGICGLITEIDTKNPDCLELESRKKPKKDKKCPRELLPEMKEAAIAIPEPSQNGDGYNVVHYWNNAPVDVPQAAQWH